MERKLGGLSSGPLQVEFLTDDIAVLSSASGSFREAYVYQRNNLVWLSLHGEPPGKFVDFFKEALLTVKVLEDQDS